MTFPFRDTPSGHAELRSSKGIEQDSLKALHENLTVSRKKGLSLNITVSEASDVMQDTVNT